MKLEEVTGIPISDDISDRLNESDEEILIGYVRNYLSQIDNRRRQLTPTELLYDFAVWALAVGIDNKWDDIEYDGVRNF